MALLIISLIFIAPIILILLDLKSSTELFTTRTRRLSVYYTLIAMMFISLFTPKHYWLDELTYGKVWISGLLGGRAFCFQVLGKVESGLVWSYMNC